MSDMPGPQQPPYPQQPAAPAYPPPQQGAATYPPPEGAGAYPPPQTPPAYAAPQAPPQPGYAPPGAGYYAPAAYAPVPALPPALAGAQLATYGSRVGAALIDALFSLTIVGIVVNWFLMGRQGPMNGMTLGKQVVGIRVARGDGQPVSVGFALLRELVVRWLLFGIVGWFLLGIPALLDILWPLWDQQNQALHDKMVNTFVVFA